MNLTCREINYSQALSFYNQYEHLGCPGRGVYHWGAFAGDLTVASVSFGTACFGLHRGIFADLSSRYGLRVYQLTRGGTAPFAPHCTGSWIVSRGLQHLRMRRGDCIVVAYSDPCVNEMGTIYQASNFLYLGRTSPKGQSDYIIGGERISGWKVRRLFGTRDIRLLREADPHVIRIPLHSKHRYLYLSMSKVLRRRVLLELERLVLPYPKRHIEGIGSMNLTELIERREGNKQARCFTT